MQRYRRGACLSLGTASELIVCDLNSRLCDKGCQLGVSPNVQALTSAKSLSLFLQNVNVSA